MEPEKQPLPAAELAAAVALSKIDSPEGRQARYFLETGQIPPSQEAADAWVRQHPLM
jgi:hypothetical protein